MTASTAGRNRLVRAVVAFRRAVVARARALHEGRSVTHRSRNGWVLEWLGHRVPADAVLRDLGARLETVRGVRFLASTHRTLIDRVPARYQRFRRSAPEADRWYRAEAAFAIRRRRVTGLEVDLMLLVMLRHVRRFIALGGDRVLWEDTRIGSLENVKTQYVAQVLVDEATDFSAVQLACMVECAHPDFRSFFACGDVRQRVTPWGVRDLDELRWVAPDFVVREVRIGYRQTRRLVKFARAVAALGGGEPPAISVPEGGEDAEVPPLLGESLQGGPLAIWLKDRIREIEQALTRIPSIAVFVDGDARIDPLVESLRPLLAEHNLEFLGCKESRVVGGEAQIRVFDIQYIKGLEFEAAFFVGVDGLVARRRDLGSGQARSDTRWVT